MADRFDHRSDAARAAALRAVRRGEPIPQGLPDRRAPRVARRVVPSEIIRVEKVTRWAR